MLTPRPIGESGLERDAISRIREGDERAFQALFEQYYVRLIQFASSCVTRPIAEELVQDVFFAVWQERETLDPEGGVQAYLFKAVRNRTVDAMRHVAVVQNTASKSSPDSQSSESAEDLRLSLRESLSAMPVQYRVVVGLRWTFGLNPAEIAFVLGKTVKVIEHYIDRSLDTLSERIAIPRK